MDYNILLHQINSDNDTSNLNLTDAATNNFNLTDDVTNNFNLTDDVTNNFNLTDDVTNNFNLTDDDNNSINILLLKNNTTNKIKNFNLNDNIIARSDINIKDEYYYDDYADYEYNEEKLNNDMNYENKNTYEEKNITETLNDDYVYYTNESEYTTAYTNKKENNKADAILISFGNNTCSIYQELEKYDHEKLLMLNSTLIIFDEIKFYLKNKNKNISHYVYNISYTRCQNANLYDHSINLYTGGSVVYENEILKTDLPINCDIKMCKFENKYCQLGKYFPIHCQYNNILAWV
jgi:hypothetical protein